MIVVHCACGEVYKIADDKAGYSIICTKCKRVIDLAAPNKNTPRTAKLSHSKSSILFAVLLILVALVGYNLKPAHQKPAVSVKSKPQKITASSAIPATPLKVIPAQSASKAPKHTIPLAYIPMAKDRAEIDRQARSYHTSQISDLKIMPASQVSDKAARATGTNLTPPIGTSGRSTLTVINGNSQDAVIKLVGTDNGLSTDVVYRYVYIKANDQTTLENISAGGYTLLYKIGSDWNGQGSFTEGEQVYEFGKLLDFKEYSNAVESGDTEIHWSEMTVTLHPEITGNVKAKEIPAEDFDEPR